MKGRLSRSAPSGGGLALAYRPYYGALDTWRARSPEQMRRSVLAVGSPRSGTTWLANILAGVAGRPLLDEPTTAKRVPEMRDRHGWDGRPFREPGEPDPDLAFDLGRIFTGTYLGGGMIGRSRTIDAALWRRTPVVAKAIDLNLLLPWLARELPWLRVVHLVRHPFEVVASQTGREGSIWSTQTWLSVSYQRFMAAHPEYDAPVEHETVEERQLTAWCIEHAWLRDRQEDLGAVVPVRYETLRADPEGEARRLAEVLGLPAPTAETLARVVRPSRSVNVDAERSTIGRSADAAWRERFSPELVERLRAILERYDYPAYGPETLEPGA